jgi:integrase
MSITKTSKGYRVQIYDRRTGKTVALSRIIPGTPSLFPTKRDAKAARERARDRINAHLGPDGPTLQAFYDRWTTDRLFARPKQSTDAQNHWATREFIELFGVYPIAIISHEHVAEYLAGGNRSSRVGALRAMFNDAASAKAGRLVTTNPFAKLGLQRSTGNRHKQPPPETVVWKLIAAARKTAGPNFAAWLQVACFTGLRPGELDGLRWDSVDFSAGRIIVREQFNARTRSFTSPKNGLVRPALLTPPAIEALTSVARTSEFCFVAPRGNHYTPASRRAPWKRTRDATGYTDSLYLSTRHFCGSYLVNVLGIDSEDAAFALGHQDGGELIRSTYGHRDREAGLNRVAAAFQNASNVRNLRRSA